MKICISCDAPTPSNLFSVSNRAVCLRCYMASVHANNVQRKKAKKIEFEAYLSGERTRTKQRKPTGNNVVRRRVEDILEEISFNKEFE